jgi:hypothetical protein
MLELGPAQLQKLKAAREAAEFEVASRAALSGRFHQFAQS